MFKITRGRPVRERFRSQCSSTLIPVPRLLLSLILSEGCSLSSRASRVSFSLLTGAESAGEDEEVVGRGRYSCCWKWLALWSLIQSRSYHNRKEVKGKEGNRKEECAGCGEWGPASCPAPATAEEEGVTHTAGWSPGGPSTLCRVSRRQHSTPQLCTTGSSVQGSSSLVWSVHWSSGRRSHGRGPFIRRAAHHQAG